MPFSNLSVLQKGQKGVIHQITLNHLQRYILPGSVVACIVNGELQSLDAVQAET